MDAMKSPSNSNKIIHRNCRNNLKIHMDTQKPRVIQIFMNSQRTDEYIIIIDFKLYNRVIVIKA